MKALLERFIICVLVAVAVSGCAGMGPTGGDSDRLLNAISVDDVHYVRGAVQSGTLQPNQRVPAEGYSQGAPVIALAARAAALEILRFLISAGADVNARTPVHETPIMLAAFFYDDDAKTRSDRHERAVRLLADAGADLENYGYTALAYAAYQGNERMVRLLLERGARVDGSAGRDGTYVNTPLMMAAIQGHERVVRLLLRAGANADVRVFGGHTAAEFAAKYNHKALAQLLLCAQKQYGVGAFGGQCRELLGYGNAYQDVAWAPR